MQSELVDDGDGFDWQSYMQRQERQENGPSGRGIGLAKYVSFDEVGYFGRGNEVHTVVYVKPL